MNYNSGVFSCPQCGSKELEGCKFWLSKTEYVYNSPKTKWIFYNGPNNCVCCLGCYFCCDKESCYPGNRRIMKCSPFQIENYICFPFYLLFVILYAIFCSIGDICNICCCKYLEYEDVYENNYSKRYVLAKNNIEVWKECKGFSEDDISSSSKEFKCDNCGYASKNVINFIPINTIKVNNNTDMSFTPI